MSKHIEPLEIAPRTAVSDGDVTPPPREPDTANIHGPAASQVRDSDSFRGFLKPAATPGALNLDHYEVKEVLGRGGFGVVLKAWDTKLHRMVAIKMMSTEIAATSPARKRFLREARASAAVRHENVVAIHAVEEEPIPYLVMEYIPGESLQQRLDGTGPLATAEILRIGAQIARGLAAAHSTNLVHRDIKPANIILEKADDRAKLTDFGLARAADDASLTTSGVVAGTPMFMAPEQASGDAIDHRADLFSFGSVLYVMASGRPPFRASSSMAVLKRVVEETPRPIREIIPEVPEWLCAIIEKLHAKDPAARYQSAAEVADVLENCQAQLKAHGGLKDASWIPQSKKRPETKAGSNRFPLIAAGVLLIAFLGAYAAGAFRLPPRNTAVFMGDSFINPHGMVFAKIPKGVSWFGGGGGNVGAKQFDVTREFYLGVYEVTQEEWRRVMGPDNNPSRFSRTGDNRDDVANISDDDLKRFPAEGMSWDDCQVFLQRLNEQAKVEGWVYRLPTSDEWEFACRGGPQPKKADFGFDYYFDVPAHQAGDKANHADAGLNRPCKVGSYPPNRLGLHDMHGNVFEYCDDRRQDDAGAPLCLLRGGAWHDGHHHIRTRSVSTASPRANYVGAGLRIALVPAP